MRTRRPPDRPTGRKHTRETINRALEARGYQLLEEYGGQKAYQDYLCPNGHIWNTCIDSILYRDRDCPHCPPVPKAQIEQKRPLAEDGRKKNRSFFRELTTQAAEPPTEREKT